MMANRQVFSCTPNLRVSMERYRSVEHIPAQQRRGKVKQSRVKNLRLLGVGMRNGWNVQLIERVELSSYVLLEVKMRWKKPKRKVWELKPQVDLAVSG